MQEPSLETPKHLTARLLNHEQKKGELSFNGASYPCVFGRSGISEPSKRRQGDGSTPAGTYALRKLWYRADKVPTITCALPTQIIHEQDGWCDDASSPDYNRHVLLPFAGGHQELFRPNDDLYDLVLEIGYNDNPAVPGLGSEIFMHVAREAMTPTAGCIALKKEDLVKVIADLNETSTLTILPSA